MSWESTELYYRRINEEVKRRLGRLHSASLALVSVDFEPIERMQHRGDWDQTATVLCRAAQQVEAAGADVLLICTNTMHKVADSVQASIGIPLLHLADATAEAIRRRGLTKVGLLGTTFTMEQDFYIGRLKSHGLDVRVPGDEDRRLIHRVIYEELCLGDLRDASRDEFLRVMKQLHSDGAEGIIEGCTEIAMLVGAKDTEIPLFDTTCIHAEAAVDFALGS